MHHFDAEAGATLFVKKKSELCCIALERRGASGRVGMELAKMARTSFFVPCRARLPFSCRALSDLLYQCRTLTGRERASDFAGFS